MKKLFLCCIALCAVCLKMNADTYSISIDKKHVAEYTIDETSTKDSILVAIETTPNDPRVFNFQLAIATTNAASQDEVGLFGIIGSSALGYAGLKVHIYEQTLRHPVSISHTQKLTIEIEAYEPVPDSEVGSKVIELYYDKATKIWTTALTTK